MPVGRRDRARRPRRVAGGPRPRPAAATCRSSTPRARSSPRCTPRSARFARRRLLDRAHRPRRPRGDRRHARRGAGRHPRHRLARRGRRPGRAATRTGSPTSPRPRSPSTRRRPSIERLARALPERRRAARQRHLLRHPEPAAGGARARRPTSTCARRRLGQLVELQPPRRGRPTRRCRRPPRRGRDAGRPRLARRRPPRRRHGRRVGPRAPRAARRRAPRQPRSGRASPSTPSPTRTSSSPSPWRSARCPSPSVRTCASAQYLLKQKRAGREQVPADRRARAAVRLQPRLPGLRQDPAPDRHPPQAAERRQTCSRRWRSAARRWCSIAGGEPLLHPEIDRMVAALVERKIFVYLCTNARADAAAASTGSSRRRTSRASSTSTGCASATTRPSTARACSTRPSTPSGRRSEQGFRVTTNTTFFNTDTPKTVRDVLDFLNDDLGVDAMMISPGYAYEKAPDQEHFLGVDPDAGAVPRGVRRRPAPQVAAQPHAAVPRLPRGQGRLRVHGVGDPVVLGVRLAAAVLPDERRLRRDSYQELVETTDWDSYGRGKDPALRQLHGPLRLRAVRRAGDDAVAAPVAAGHGQRPLRARPGSGFATTAGWRLRPRAGAGKFPSDSLRRRAARGVRAGSPLPTRQVVTTPPSSLVRPSRKGALNERAFRSPPPCSLRGHSHRASVRRGRQRSRVMMTSATTRTSVKPRAVPGTGL